MKIGKVSFKPQAFDKWTFEEFSKTYKGKVPNLRDAWEQVKGCNCKDKAENKKSGAITKPCKDCAKKAKALEAKKEETKKDVGHRKSSTKDSESKSSEDIL